MRHSASMSEYSHEGNFKLKDMLNTSLLDMSVELTNLRLQPHFPGPNELRIVGYRIVAHWRHRSGSTSGLMDRTTGSLRERPVHGQARPWTDLSSREPDCKLSAPNVPGQGTIDKQVRHKGYEVGLDTVSVGSMTPNAVAAYHLIITLRHGNAFRVTGPLWGESTIHRWIPLTKGQ